MLRSIELFGKIAFHSRVAVISSTNQRQFGVKLMRGYTSRANELQKLIDIKGKKNLDSVGQKEDQCIAYIREKNVAKIEELTKSCVLGDFIHHSIINMHIEMGSTELALDHLDEVRKSRPNFKLDRSEAARLACAMYKEEREWREIIRIFTENKQLRLQSDNVTAIYHFLQSVAETGNAAELNELVDVLIDNNFLVKDNQSAGYMVKVHLVNNDLVQAVRTFEKQYDERKFTSHHVPLAVALIKANEMEKLRKVFKLMESKYSEANALLTLVISFIECGNIGLARVLLKNASSRISDNSFNNYWARYHKYGEYSVLQGVLDATVGLDYDRCNIYSYLLVHYCDQKRTEDALELWRKQRDQNEQPTNGFLQRLAAHLDENGIKYPFQVPKADTPTLASHSLPAENEMKNALRNKDIDAALKMWNKINSNSTRYEYLASGLIQLLCKSNRNTEAFDIATQTIDLEKRVNDAAFCDLIQRIADDGNWQSLERLGDSLSHTTKRAIRFGGELLRAYEKNGKWNEFFGKTLEKIKMNANVNERVLQSNLLKHLQKQSIPLDEFDEFAQKAAEMHDCRLLNVLWAHYFLIDSPECHILYDRFEKYYPTRFEIAFLGSHLAEQEDDGKLEELMEFAKTKNRKQLPALKVVILIARMTKLKFLGDD